MVDPLVSPNGGRPEQALSPQERRVLALLAEGAAPRTIAAALDVSSKTVEAHVYHMRRKLGLASNWELRAWAAREEVSDVYTT